MKCFSSGRTTRNSTEVRDARMSHVFTRRGGFVA